MDTDSASCGVEFVIMFKTVQKEIKEEILAKIKEELKAPALAT